jgi:hypothetical protein
VTEHDYGADAQTASRPTTGAPILTSHTSVATDCPSRYLKQLLSHLGRHLPQLLANPLSVPARLFRLWRLTLAFGVRDRQSRLLGPLEQARHAEREPGLATSYDGCP